MADYTISNGHLILEDSGYARINEVKSLANSSGQYVIGAIKFDELNAYNGEIQFWTTPTSGNASTANSTHAQRMVINKDGKVGIGTTSPGRKLSIIGNLGLSGPILLGSNSYAAGGGSLILSEGSATGDFKINQWDGSAWTDHLYVVAATGKVGIGTTVPTAPITVSGNNKAYIDWNETNTSTSWRWVVRSDDGNFQVQGTSGATGNPITIAKTNNAVTFDGKIIANVGGDGGAPDYTFTGDTDTGFFREGTNTIGISTGGVRRWSIDTGQITSQTTGGARMTNTNGTASVPTFTFNDDNDTGIYRAAANSVALSTSGTERMRIDSSGNVGIGQSPYDASTRLTVKTDGTNDWGILVTDGSGAKSVGLFVNGSGAGEIQAYKNDQSTVGLRLTAEDNANSYFNSGGNVGIGITAPGNKLEVKGLIGIQRIATTDISTIGMEGNFIFNAANGYNIHFQHNTTPLVSFMQGGNVGIATTSPSYKLEVNGTFYSAGSSVAYKENIEDLEVDSSLIHSLRPVSYDYKKKYKDFGYNVKEGKQMGLISEEVAEIIPELAIMKDGKPKNVDYQKLAVVLLAEVQNLKKDIEELKK
jgi:hypothetical protein